jgi:hypothetical protein
LGHLAVHPCGADLHLPPGGNLIPVRINKHREDARAVVDDLIADRERASLAAGRRSASRASKSSRSARRVARAPRAGATRRRSGRSRARTGRRCTPSERRTQRCRVLLDEFGIRSAHRVERAASRLPIRLAPAFFSLRAQARLDDDSAGDPLAERGEKSRESLGRTLRACGNEQLVAAVQVRSDPCRRAPTFLRQDVPSASECLLSSTYLAISDGRQDDAHGADRQASARWQASAR